VFCASVEAGEGRVFKCLAENMASADFGASCQAAIMEKLRRREGNWRLDPQLRRACKADVEK
jgi:Golgi apparatus protein 1